MRFLFSEAAYIRASSAANKRMVLQTFRSLQFFRTDTSHRFIPFTSNRSPPHLRSNHSINRCSKYKYIPDLDSLLHHFLHRCFMHSDLSSNCNPFHSNILQREVFIQAQTSCTHTHPLHNEFLLFI